MDAAAIRARAAELPAEPGVYVFQDGDDATTVSGQAAVSAIGSGDGRVLYVGKAVDLRDRVRSYTDPRSERIAGMVDRAQTITVAVTDTETQALLLEANLIKRHSPRYNVRLKDDKSYPLVQLSDHAAPRIEITRDPDPGATVYGPYTNRGRLETVLKAIRDIYGLRGCSDHKYANRDRPCIDYEMGICTAPCTDEISTPAYQADVDAVKRFFNGETGVLAEPLRKAMQTAAADQAFERAATLRDRLDVVEQFHTDRGAAVRDRDDDRMVDVLGVAIDGDDATVARLHSEAGQLVDRDRHQVLVPHSATDHIGAVVGAFIQQYYADRPLPETLLVPEKPDDPELQEWLSAEGVALRVPGAGRDGRLIELAMKNARQGGTERASHQALATALDIDRADRIEGFDISHTGGDAVVGSNVLFVEGSRESSGYRRKRLPDRNDDYANMRALIEWRAQRAVEGRDDRPDPDLLLIDGGTGQLTAATDALATVGWDVPAIAIAKDEDTDRIIGPDGHLSVPDTAQSLLTQVRDEAHRFAVQYHETVRDTVETPLDNVTGVGPARRDRLLRRFGSLARIRAASVTELQDVEGIGEETARRIDQAL